MSANIMNFDATSSTLEFRISSLHFIAAQLNNIGVVLIKANQSFLAAQILKDAIKTMKACISAQNEDNNEDEMADLFGCRMSVKPSRTTISKKREGKDTAEINSSATEALKRARLILFELQHQSEATRCGQEKLLEDDYLVYSRPLKICLDRSRMRLHDTIDYSSMQRVHVEHSSVILFNLALVNHKLAVEAKYNEDGSRFMQHALQLYWLTFSAGIGIMNDQQMARTNNRRASGSDNCTTETIASHTFLMMVVLNNIGRIYHDAGEIEGAEQFFTAIKELLVFSFNQGFDSPWTASDIEINEIIMLYTLHYKSRQLNNMENAPAA